MPDLCFSRMVFTFYEVILKILDKKMAGLSTRQFKRVQIDQNTMSSSSQPQTHLQCGG
jgi:hypothetical protein